MVLIPTCYAQQSTKTITFEMPPIEVRSGSGNYGQKENSEIGERNRIQQTQLGEPIPAPKGSQSPVLPNPAPQYQQPSGVREAPVVPLTGPHPAPGWRIRPTVVGPNASPMGACAASTCIQHAIQKCPCDSCRACRPTDSCGRNRRTCWQQLCRWATYFPGRAYCPKYHHECVPRCHFPNYALWYYNRCARCGPQCHGGYPNRGPIAPGPDTTRSSQSRPSTDLPPQSPESYIPPSSTAPNY